MIYLLYQHKSCGSTHGRLLCAATTERKLRRAVEHCIHLGLLQYGETISKKQQIQDLRQDWENGWMAVNSKLVNGIMDVTADGKVIKNQDQTVG